MLKIVMTDKEEIVRKGSTLSPAQVGESGSSAPTRFEWAIIALGFLLRLTQYLSNRSLWLDEAMLVLNIINRSFVQLLKPLDYAQGAPIGFLMLERSAVQLFGPNEYELRLFPFLCGVFSLLLFHRLAKQSLSSVGVPIALGLFATSAPLIYFASEAKQYSSDMLVTLLLSCAAIYYASGKVTMWRIALFGLLGALAIWFSHPAAFVLGGIALSLILFAGAEERGTKLRNLSIIFSLWGLSLGACYLLFLRRLSADQYLLSYWSFSFPPPHVFSVATARWYVSTFFEILRYPVGLDLPGIAGFAFLVGAIAMFSSQRQKFFILISPLLLTLLAAGFHKYPFSGRLLLFTVPALLLFIGAGADQIWRKTKTDAPAVGVCFIALLFFYPLLFAGNHLFKPVLRDEIKPVMNYLQTHVREGDVVYLHDESIPAFRYYAPRYHFSNVSVSQQSLPENSENSWATYERDMDRLRGRGRVWILFSLSETEIDVNEEKLLLYFLDKRGTRLDQFEAVGAAAYLYDLDPLAHASK